jgi:hypothetical protein
MGYRSNVTAVFYTTTEKFSMMKLYVDKHFPAEFKGYLTIQGERAYVFKLENVKWYDSYPEVQAFKRFLSNFSQFAEDGDDSTQWSYEFLRIGEDSDDIDQTYSDNAENVISLSWDVEVYI